jgi:hypothetical protein
MPTDTDRNLFDLVGDLSLTIGGLSSAVEEQQRSNDRRMRADSEESPRFVRPLGQVVLNSSGFGVVGFDNKPAQGHFWYVRKLVVAGVTPTTAVAGRADVFVGAQDLRQVTSLAQIGSANWRDQATTLPLIGVYGRGELTVPSPYDLYVIVSGGTSGQQVIVTGDIEDYQEGSALGRLGF